MYVYINLSIKVFFPIVNTCVSVLLSVPVRTYNSRDKRDISAKTMQNKNGRETFSASAACIYHDVKCQWNIGLFSLSSARVLAGENYLCRLMSSSATKSMKEKKNRTPCAISQIRKQPLELILTFNQKK